MSLAPTESDSDSTPFSQSELRASFLETFLSNFFQERNIKWILIVGASIVFGSSLMLVTKSWPQWTPALKYLTILGYTAAIFCVSEVSRKRLRLNATYRVLQSLTLLLLPVCFLSLTWLSPGTAHQDGLGTIGYIGLMIPAIALLWIASKTILDHWLHGRQQTFLVCFHLLCIAGALPAATTPLAAFVFMGLCWGLMTVGVVKVNRHTFWLAEEHRFPRIFGFLPIAMLGLLFVILVSSKVIGELPWQWIGFAIVMASATILQTTRTIAEVFRRRSGDLVRPLPWPIVVPMFVGLAMTVLGVGLSFSGFTYVGETTYSVIPTSIVAAILFAFAARDTRHPGFVWASLVAITIAYQCSPTMFSNLVHTIRSATSEAIHQERVPITLYGLTYLPLLSLLVVVSRWFDSRRSVEISMPIKHFVTLLSGTLFCVALSEMVTWSFISPFLVSSVNSVVFVAFAFVLQDRRLALPGIAALILAVATSIPALNQMAYIDVEWSWVPVALAALTLVMTSFRFPDTLLQRIPVPASQSLGHNDLREWNLIQGAGYLLAFALAVHWMASCSLTFLQPLSTPALAEYSCLLCALLIYTIRSPRYLPATIVWVFVAFEGLRWVSGFPISLSILSTYGTYLLIGGSVASYLVLELVKRKTQFGSLHELRQSIGLNLQASTIIIRPSSIRAGWALPASFSMSLFDLTLLALSLLIGTVHFPMIAVEHIAMLTGQLETLSVPMSLAAPIAVVWLLGITLVLRNRASGFVIAMLLPLASTSLMISAGVLGSASGLLFTWAMVQGALSVGAHRLSLSRKDPLAGEVIMRVCQTWLAGILLMSCVSLELPFRVVAAISLTVLVGYFADKWNSKQLCAFAILGNIHLFLLVAFAAGCRGVLLPNSPHVFESQSIAYLFLAGCVSVLFFGNPHRRIACEEAGDWAKALRCGLVTLIVTAILFVPLQGIGITAMVIGLTVLIASEVMTAIRRNHELRVWTACGFGVASVAFLLAQHVISIGNGVSQFVMLGVSAACLTVAELSPSQSRLNVLRRPMLIIGQSLPSVVAGLVVFREVFGLSSSSTGLNSLALMIAAGIYFQQSHSQRRPALCIPAIIIVNAAFCLMWSSLGWTEAELYLVPVGLSVLALVELMKKELPTSAHDPLRYIAALFILCSPLFEVLDGSWIHMFALMLLCVVVILAAIGLRVRSLVYAGSGFLFADIVAMVIRSTIHNPTSLWICGVALGIGVIALAAFCENHRDKLLSRIRMVSAELATWR